MELKLHSPSGADPAVFQWPLKDKQDGAVEIVETIRCVCNDFPEIKTALENHALNEYDTRDFESMRTLCERYNKAIDSVSKLWKGTSVRKPTRPSLSLLRHILHKVYNQSVDDPDRLNSYEPFSPQVYGETSFDFVAQMIEETDFDLDTVFLDLGSGVGQVVLQVAAMTTVNKCIGIEKAETPCQYAERMDHNFRFWMRWYGKSYSEYELLQGDFLSKDNRTLIENASIVFANNYTFGPTVDHKLKEVFQEMKDGSRIISSRAFCHLQFRITDRTLSDIGAMMHVREVQPKKGSVSWTDKPVSYYLHCIDRTKLQRYFEKKKDEERLDAAEGGKRRRHQLNYSMENSNGSVFDEDSEVFGPTTRRKWIEWIRASKGNKKNGTGNGASINGNNSSGHDEDEEPDTKRPVSRRGRKSVIANGPVAPTTPASSAASSPPAASGASNASMPGAVKAKRGRPKGTQKKNVGRTSKYSSSLDTLHNHTLYMSTIEAEGSNPPPGCIEVKLEDSEDDEDSSSRPDSTEEQLPSPANGGSKAGGASPRTAVTGNLFAHLNNIVAVNEEDDDDEDDYNNEDLERHIASLRQQYKYCIKIFKSGETYRNSLEQKISEEKERKVKLEDKQNQLETQIKTLMEDTVILLKARMCELDLEQDAAPSQLLAKAKEIVRKHKELLFRHKRLENDVGIAEEKQRNLILVRQQHQMIATGTSLSKEQLLKEISSSLICHRKKSSSKSSSSNGSTSNHHHHHHHHQQQHQNNINNNSNSNSIVNGAERGVKMELDVESNAPSTGPPTTPAPVPHDNAGRHHHHHHKGESHSNATTNNSSSPHTGSNATSNHSSTQLPNSFPNQNGLPVVPNQMVANNPLVPPPTAGHHQQGNLVINLGSLLKNSPQHSTSTSSHPVSSSHHEGQPLIANGNSSTTVSSTSSGKKQKRKHSQDSHKSKSSATPAVPQVDSTTLAGQLPSVNGALPTPNIEGSPRSSNTATKALQREDEKKKWVVDTQAIGSSRMLSKKSRMLSEMTENKELKKEASGGVSIKIKALPPKSPPRTQSPELPAHSPRSSSSSDGSSYAHRHKKFREKRHHHKKFSRPGSPVSTPTPPAAATPVPVPVVAASQLSSTLSSASSSVLNQSQTTAPAPQSSSVSPMQVPVVSQHCQPARQQQQQQQNLSQSLAPRVNPSHSPLQQQAQHQAVPTHQSAMPSHSRPQNNHLHPSLHGVGPHAGHRTGPMLTPHPQQHSQMPNYSATHGPSPGLFRGPPSGMPPNAANFAPPHTQFNPSMPPLYPQHPPPAPHPYYRSMYSHRQ